MDVVLTLLLVWLVAKLLENLSAGPPHDRADPVPDCIDQDEASDNSTLDDECPGRDAGDPFPAPEVFSNPATGLSMCSGSSSGWDTGGHLYGSDSLWEDASHGLAGDDLWTGMDTSIGSDLDGQGFGSPFD